jgi:DNA helicase-2/ATP-dependent DNA helicase PcrA
MQHPEFQLEESKLQSIVDWISKKYLDKETINVPFDKIWETFGGANFATALILFERSKQDREKWVKVIDTPYFGRMDLLNEKKEIDSYYIGQHGFRCEDNIVLDWRAPISRIFYQKVEDFRNVQRYIAPDGLMHARFLLKRHLLIKRGKLQDVSDEVDRRNGEVETNDREISKELLIRQIQTRGDPELQDIIQTIQSDQDDLIRETADKVLVIDGVAGSGKTSIGYHRLAYLLFPETNSGIRRNRVIVFGPNRLFLSFVQNLLPTLDIESVIQVSFDDWALEKMGLIKRGLQNEQVRLIKLTESSFEIFINSNSTKTEKRNSWKLARLKGSLRFGKVLDNYIEHKKNILTKQLDGLILGNIGEKNLSLLFTSEDVNETLSNSKNLPLTQLISLLKEALIRLIPKKLDKALQPYSETMSLSSFMLRKKVDESKNRQVMITEAEKKLSIVLDELWFQDQVISIYSQLLVDRQILQKCSVGELSKQEVDLLLSKKPLPGSLDLEDIPSLLYLYLLLNGNEKTVFDHIIIDEAQDFSPLQFKILQQLNPDNSMTVVGDLAQGILAHRGISDWKELQPIFDNKLSVKEVRQNYRATEEITETNNELLCSVQKNNAKLAIPLGRHGVMPCVVLVNSWSQLLVEILKDAKLLLENGFKHIGMITKSHSDIQRLFDYLSASDGIKATIISDRDDNLNYSGNVIIVPAALSKGLEFEAVMVVNVSSGNFSLDVNYDGRLLYVATTRALHFLRLYSIGEPTGFLQSALSKGKIQRLEVHNDYS